MQCWGGGGGLDKTRQLLISKGGSHLLDSYGVVALFPFPGSNLYFFLLLLPRVPNVSEVWKQGAPSSLGGTGEEGASLAFPPLRVCSYARLQLLQSLCPAAAAAIMILSRQMPEMRNSTTSCKPSGSPLSIAPSTVTADAWCPRALMEVDESSLLFFMPDGCVSLYFYH